MPPQARQGHPTTNPEQPTPKSQNHTKSTNPTEGGAAVGLCWVSLSRPPSARLTQG